MNAFKLGILIASLLIIAVVYDWTTLDNLIVALVALLVVAWMWSRVSLNRLGLARELSSDRARVGDIITEEITIKNHSRLPKLWIEVQDMSSLPGHRVSAVVSLRGKGSTTWSTQTRAIRRGKYRLGPITVHSGDPIGIFMKRRSLPVNHELVVYPPIVDVSNVVLPQTNMSGGAVRNRSFAVSSPTIAGVREYTMGDPTSRISWTATARRGMMMVKEFDPDPSADLWIMLDLSEDSQFDLRGSRSAGESWTLADMLDTTTEYIVAIGGSIAERALHEGRKVGMVVNRTIPVRLDADSSQRQWFKIFEVIATAMPYGNRSLVEALAAESQRFARTNGLIVVTSSPDKDWATAARALVQRQISVSAVVVDAGGIEEDDVSPLVEELAGSRVHVTRYPTHRVSGHHDASHPIPSTYIQ